MASIYLAGPITGSSYDGVTEWRETFRDIIDNICAWTDDFAEIRCFSPMRGKTYLKGEDSIQSAYDVSLPLSTQAGITTRDRADVMHCDVLVANFLGATKVSVGTVMEIAWADAYRKPIVLIMEEENLHNHPMIKQVSGFVVDSLHQAASICAAILLPQVDYYRGKR